MAFRLSDFRATALAQGGARPTLFETVITSPPGLGGLDLSQVPFSVTSTTLPGSTLGFIEVPYFGRKIRLAGDRTFDTWTVTVINDENFKIRHAMEKWHHSINNLETGINKAPNPTQYKADAQVKQYSKKGDVIRTYRFQGLFPINVSTIDVNWNDTDAIEYFQVTFQYDWYTVEGGPGTLDKSN